MAAVLEKGRPFRFQARGLSMHPFIKDGDILTVSPLRRALRVGDVAAYRVAGRPSLAVHRVTAVRGEVLILRGDNAGVDDDPVAGADVLGLVTRVERDGRTVHVAIGAGRRLLAGLSQRGALRPMVLRVRALLGRRKKTP